MTTPTLSKPELFTIKSMMVLRMNTAEILNPLDSHDALETVDHTVSGRPTGETTVSYDTRDERFATMRLRADQVISIEDITDDVRQMVLHRKDTANGRTVPMHIHPNAKTVVSFQNDAGKQDVAFIGTDLQDVVSPAISIRKNSGSGYSMAAAFAEISGFKAKSNITVVPATSEENLIKAAIDKVQTPDPEVSGLRRPPAAGPNPHFSVYTKN